MKKKLEESAIDWKRLPLQAFAGIGDPFENSPRAVGTSVLMQHLLAQGSGHITEMQEEGSILEDEGDTNGTRYLKLMDKLGGRLLHKWIGDEFYRSLFMWEHGL